jgi:hypothetical protein
VSLSELLRTLQRLLGRRHALVPPDLIVPGARVRLRMPLASSHRVWIPAGASGIVIGWDTPRRRVSVELDAPRTVVTVPWAWVEDEPASPPESAGPPPPGPAR